MNEIPDNSKHVNYQLFILDPLSVIIKLAIFSNKSVGTKFRIQDNVIYIQEPGYFQSICRLYYNVNKTEIQYLYNPIHFACLHFLSPRFTDKTPNIPETLWFRCPRIDQAERDIQVVSSRGFVSKLLHQYYRELFGRKYGRDSL